MGSAMGCFIITRKSKVIGFIMAADWRAACDKVKIETGDCGVIINLHPECGLVLMYYSSENEARKFSEIKWGPTLRELIYTS